MRGIMPVIFVLMLPAIAVASDTEVVIQGYMSPLNISPAFDHGYVAVYEDVGIAVYASDGSLAMRIASPDGGRIHNADIHPDGSVVIATEREEWPSEVGGVSIFNPDGSLAGRIATGPYVPSQVCFAPDHSIWTLGSEDWRRLSGGNRDRRDLLDYFLLRHYSSGGALLGEYFSRSQFPADINTDPGRIFVGFGGLRIANGRIGAVLWNAGKDNQHLWLEADLDGKETGRWSVPSGAKPSAMTESGSIYAQGHGLWALDRASGSWRSVPQPSNDKLLGAEGNTLVFLVPGTNRIRKVTQP